MFEREREDSDSNVAHNTGRIVANESPLEKSDDGADGHHGHEEGDTEGSEGEHLWLALRHNTVFLRLA